MNSDRQDIVTQIIGAMEGITKVLWSAAALLAPWLVPLAPAAAGTRTYSSADPSTSGIAPEPFGGNLSCADVAPAGATWSELKVEPVESGRFTDGTVKVKLYVPDGSKKLNWSSNVSIDAVIVKAGKSGNVYRYDPEATADKRLHGQVNPSTGTYYGLSHV